MPDTVFDEDTLAAASEAMGEEEERPLTFAELGVPGPLVRVLAADDKKTAFPIQADTFPIVGWARHSWPWSHWIRQDAGIFDSAGRSLGRSGCRRV